MPTKRARVREHRGGLERPSEPKEQHPGAPARLLLGLPPFPRSTFSPSLRRAPSQIHLPNFFSSPIPVAAADPSGQCPSRHNPMLHLDHLNQLSPAQTLLLLQQRTFHHVTQNLRHLADLEAFRSVRTIRRRLGAPRAKSTAQSAVLGMVDQLEKHSREIYLKCLSSSIFVRLGDSRILQWRSVS